jgi:hypothetical protein
MTEVNQNKFFQNEKKFIVGNNYETLRVKSPPYRGYLDLETCDEIGTIIPNSEKFLGRYVSSQHYGYGDNGTRYDYFINDKEEKITNCLEYDGTTRYRDVTTFMDERINYLKMVESVGEQVNIDNKNDHILKYVLNELIVREICSYIGPNYSK